MTTASPTARADEGAEPKQPVAFAERPLTLPRLTLAPYASVGARRVEAVSIALRPGAEVDIAVGASFGVSVPVLVRLGPSARLDTGVSFEGLVLETEVGPPFDDPNWMEAGMGIPFRVTFNPARVVHLGLATGFHVDDLTEAARTIRVPLHLVAGFAVPGAKGPVVDIDLTFGWSHLFTPGASRPEGLHPDAIRLGPTGVASLFHQDAKVHPGVYGGGITTRPYIYF